MHIGAVIVARQVDDAARTGGQGLGGLRNGLELGRLTMTAVDHGDEAVMSAEFALVGQPQLLLPQGLAGVEQVRIGTGLLRIRRNLRGSQAQRILHEG